jgi:hypothetical protein
MQFRPLRMLIDWNRRRQERRRRAKLNQGGLHAGPYRTATQHKSNEPDKRLRRIDRKLLKAARQGKDFEVASLLSNDAKVDAQDKDGSTPLILAAEGLHHNCVLMLFRKGADVTIKDNDGRTALDRIPKVEEGSWEETLDYAASDSNMGPVRGYDEWVPNPLFKKAEEIRNLLISFGADTDS